MSKRETALPLTMSVPQFGRLVYRYSENSAYAAAERGDIVTIKTGDTNKRPRKRVPVRVALLRIAGNDSTLLESLVKDLCAKLECTDECRAAEAAASGFQRERFPQTRQSPRVRAREWQTRLLAELAAAPTRQQAQLILSEAEHQRLIRALPFRTREKLKATAQDIVSEKADD
jgi:hypothetical protein